MRKIDWAIVIPTWREEKYIGKLLDSLINQTVQSNEIIIVDAFSDDKTEDEVKNRQSQLPSMKFLKIPKSTIGKQRNFGVSKTSASNILFLDADVFLKDNDSIEKFVLEVEKNNPDIAIAETIPDSAQLLDRIYFKLFFWYFLKLVKPLYPLSTAMNLYVKKDSFLQVKGFNEVIKIGEDHDLVQRMVKNGSKFIFLDEQKFVTSVRRIRKEGRLGYIFKSIRIGLDALIHGFSGASSDSYYEFGKYDNTTYSN